MSSLTPHTAQQCLLFLSCFPFQRWSCIFAFSFIIIRIWCCVLRCEQSGLGGLGIPCPEIARLKIMATRWLLRITDQLQSKQYNPTQAQGIGSHSSISSTCSFLTCHVISTHSIGLWRLVFHFFSLRLREIDALLLFFQQEIAS